jgi:signal peptidase II
MDSVIEKPPMDEEADDQQFSATPNEETPISLRSTAADYAFLLVIAGGILLLDQWSKGWVRTNLALGELYNPWDWLAPYARLVHYQNTGAAFGLFKDFGLVFTILAVIVAGAILYYFPQVPRQDWPLRVAMGLQMGGALGNLADRLINGGQVTDFISVGSFPVFNVADASISTGVAVLILGMFIKERIEARERSDGGEDVMVISNPIPANEEFESHKLPRMDLDPTTNELAERGSEGVQSE